MTFSIEIDATATLKQIDDLLQNMAALEQETPETFVAWQREDMNRKFPKVDGSGLSVSTMIYPRSRLSRTKSGPTGKSVRRRSLIAARRPGSRNRPILRPALFDMLKQRMTVMMQEAATWL